MRRPKASLSLVALCTMVAATFAYGSAASAAPTITLLRDVNPGGSAHPAGSRNGHQKLSAVLDGKVYFAANEGDPNFSGQGLWRSDGTPGGTTEIDLGGGIQPADLTPAGGKLFFTAIKATPTLLGREPWVYDPQTGVATMLELNPGQASSISGSGPDDPVQMTAVGNRVYFNAVSPTDTEIFSTDGSAPTNENVNTLPSGPASAKAIVDMGGGNVFAMVSIGANGAEPFKKVGGTWSIIQDLNPGTGPGSWGGEAIGMGGSAYATLDDGSGEEMWKWNGTALTKLLDVVSGPEGSDPDTLRASSTKLAWAATYPGFGTEVFVSDGTTEGSHVIGNRNTACNVPSCGSPNIIGWAGNRIVFQEWDGVTTEQLWSSDGVDLTAAHTTSLGSFSVSIGDNTRPVSMDDDTLLFRGFNPDSLEGHEPWVTDGTVAGTQIAAIRSGTSNSDPVHLAGGGGLGFLMADDGTRGTEPYAITSGTTAPGPFLSIADAATREGRKGKTKVLSFTVTLSAPAAGPVTVNYTTVDGTAIAPTDYLAVSNAQVTIPAGQTSATADVTINGDRKRERSERFAVTLSAPSGAAIADGAATGTIKNDDR